MSRKFQALCGTLVAISFAIGLNCDENWRLRAIAAAIFLTAAMGIFLSLLVSPTFQFIGRKLVASPLKVRLTMEVVSRVLVLGLAAFFAPLWFSMCVDFYDLLQRGYPLQKEAVVIYVPGGGLWNWVEKDIGLQTADGSSTHYNLFFHPKYPKEGGRYEVVLLPKSKCILSFEPIAE